MIRVAKNDTKTCGSARNLLSLIVAVILLYPAPEVEAGEVDLSLTVAAAREDFLAKRYGEASEKLLSIHDRVDEDFQWQVHSLMGFVYCSAKDYYQGFFWLSIASLEAPEDANKLRIIKLRSCCRDDKLAGGETFLAGSPTERMGGEAGVNVMMHVGNAIREGISGDSEAKQKARKRALPAADQELMDHHLDTLGADGVAHWIFQDEDLDIGQVLGQWPRLFVTFKKKGLSVHSSLGMSGSAVEQLAESLQRVRFELSGRLHWFNCEGIDVYLLDEAFWKGVNLSELLGVEPTWSGYFLIAPKQRAIIFRTRQGHPMVEQLLLEGPGSRWLTGQLYALLALMNCPSAPPWLVSGGADYFANVAGIQKPQIWTSPEQLFLALVTLPGVSLVAPTVFLNLNWKNWNRVNRTAATGFAREDVRSLALPLDMHRFTAYLFVAYLVENGWFDPLWHSVGSGEEVAQDGPRFSVEQVTELSVPDLTKGFATWVERTAAPLLILVFPEEKPFGGI